MRLYLRERFIAVGSAEKRKEEIVAESWDGLRREMTPARSLSLVLRRLPGRFFGRRASAGGRPCRGDRPGSMETSSRMRELVNRSDFVDVDELTWRVS